MSTRCHSEDEFGDPRKECNGLESDATSTDTRTVASEDQMVKDGQYPATLLAINERRRFTADLILEACRSSILSWPASIKALLDATQCLSIEGVRASLPVAFEWYKCTEEARTDLCLGLVDRLRVSEAHATEALGPSLVLVTDERAKMQYLSANHATCRKMWYARQVSVKDLRGLLLYVHKGEKLVCRFGNECVRPLVFSQRVLQRKPRGLLSAPAICQTPGRWINYPHADLEVISNTAT